MIDPVSQQVLDDEAFALRLSLQQTQQSSFECDVAFARRLADIEDHEADFVAVETHAKRRRKDVSLDDGAFALHLSHQQTNQSSFESDAVLARRLAEMEDHEADVVAVTPFLKDAEPIAIGASTPKFLRYGTEEEPCFLFKNVFDEPPDRRGKTVENIIVRSFGNTPLPTPTGAKHWRSWRNDCPASGKALRPKAAELLNHLRVHSRGDWHVNTEPDRDFKCRDINVTGEKGGHGWHQDSQDYGSLLFLFVVGNSSKNVIRLGGKDSNDERNIVVCSGDCLVFEGQTWHTVKKIYPKTSPFKGKNEWLHNRRMSVLVRQKAPKTKMTRPHYLEK